MNLNELQAAVVKAVTQPAADSQVPIRNVRGIPPKARLDVYRSNVKGAHLETLDAAYPVTREVLGPRYWRTLLEQEINEFAADTSDLNAYGSFIPALLHEAGTRRKELAELDYLGELARLEWQIHQARFAPDDPAFDWAAFQVLEEPQQAQVRFQMSHALTVLHLTHPVDALWHQHQPGNRPKFAAENNPICCVHRAQGFEITVSRISPAEFELLEAVCTGMPLQKLPAGEESETLHTLLKWINNRLIIGFSA